MKKRIENLKANIRNLNFLISRVINYPLVSPDGINITLTNKCNLRCKMCFISSDSYDKESDLSKNEVFSIIDQAAAMGIKETILTGGEPFLRDDLFEIFEYCKLKGLRSVVTTNGTLVDKALARKIVTSHLSHIHFSVDGLEEANDFIRGKGKFAKTISAIKLVNELRNKHNSKLSLGIASTVMDHNLEDLPRLLSVADGLNVDVINFQPLLKNNANTLDRGDTIFWVSCQRLPVLDEVIKKIKSFKGKHTSVYEEPDLMLLSKYYRRSLLLSDWKCFGGYKTIFICVGDNKAPLVYTCHGICGSLKEKSIKDCWMSAEAKRLRENVKKCKNPCLQSCYSRVISGSFLRTLKGFYKTIYG